MWGCKEMWGEVWESVLRCGWRCVGGRIVGSGGNVGRSKGKMWGEGENVREV